ncbi:MAG: DUF2905 domain-containing protein [Deltaproteobacteria bacterium]|nr:DUF2905 domain-containing protein [Deltaproteobacteria bacterium]
MEFGKWLYYAGLVLILAGMVVNFCPGAISWFGKLPGDIRIQNDRSSIFIPITSMVIVSVALTVAMRLLESYLGGGK